MHSAKRYLMAGTHSISDGLGSLSGTGELDVVGTLRAQEEALMTTAGSASPDNSRVVWASHFVHPDVPQLGYVLLRDGQDRPTTYAQDQVSIELDGPGTLTLAEETVGLLKVTLSASDASSGRNLTVRTRVGGTTIETAQFVIERDPNLAEHGYELVGGTCAVDPRGRTTPRLSWSAWILLLGISLRRRRRSRLPERR
jgi:hypothetical protein